MPCPISSPHSHATSSTTSNSQRRSRRHLSVMVPSAKKVSTGSGGSGTADELLRGVPKDHVETVQKVVDRARRAADQWSVEVTDFLEPPAADAAQRAVAKLADVEARAWGGHERAERVRLALGRSEMLDAEDVTGDADAGGGIVVVLDVKGNFLFDPADHRDFLGAVLNTGIERSRVVGAVQTTTPA